jgi:hypothetical protein
MAWRGSTDFKYRLFAILVYLLPLYSATAFGGFVFERLPFLEVIKIPLAPIALVYGINPWMGLIVFFVLFLAVVRNEKIIHFVRYNTLQALLFDILLMLFGFFLQILVQGTGQNLIVETLYNVVFLATLAVCGYSIFQSSLGRYAEIPGISEAVYTQIR